MLDRVAQRFQKQGLVVLGVNVSDTPEVVKAYAAKKNLSYPMVMDPGSEVAARYGVEKLPSLIVIDRQGNVTAYKIGVVDESSLSEIISAAL